MRCLTVVGLVLAVVSCGTRRTPEPPMPVDIEPRVSYDRNVLYFIDGRTASRADFRQLPPDSIESIEILKNRAAVARYGPGAEVGVIRVTTKRAR
jgi:hypothetical protein